MRRLFMQGLCSICGMWVPVRQRARVIRITAFDRKCLKVQYDPPQYRLAFHSYGRGKCVGEGMVAFELREEPPVAS